MTDKNQTGQIALITLLVVTTATTIALSLIGRSTTDLTISNQVEESSRAFSAAEAGIEASLQSGVAGAGEPVTGVNYTTTKTDIGATTGVYSLPRTTSSGETATVWLADHDAGGALIRGYTNNTIDVCWTNTYQPALEAGVFYQSGNYRVARLAFDVNAASHANNFDSDFSSPNSTTDGCGQSGYYGKRIDFTTLGINPATDLLLALRLKPLYAAAQLAVRDPSGGMIPLQGYRWDSLGNTGGGVSRKVVVYQQYRTPPSIFDYVIYSQSGSFGH